MCLIVCAYNQHPDFKLILAANRDEFYARPTAAAHWWKDQPQVLAGRDLQAGGTWMGINKNGRFAAVTNYRDLPNIREDARSRGELPTHFLLGEMDAQHYVEQVSEQGAAYNGFNLIVLGEELGYISNYAQGTQLLNPGIYGLSNALLDTPWTKVTRAKQMFAEVIASSFDAADLIACMQDVAVANDEDLPETGLDYEREKALSSICIRTPHYGTCCTTAITIDHQGMVTFTEQSYPVGDRSDQVVTFEFKINNK